MVSGCTTPTSERKPFCIEHLDHLEYVRQVKASLEKRRAELELAERSNGWRRLDVRGAVSLDVLGTLAARGCLTVPRLAVEVWIGQRAARAFVRRLKQAGLVALERGREKGHEVEVVRLGRVFGRDVA